MKKMLAILGAGSAAIALSGCETVAEAVQPTHHATLTGAAEVPGPGDPDGSGRAEISMVDAADRVCYEIWVSNIATPTAAHIHRGATGVAGPPVITIDEPTDGHVSSCEDIDGTLADEINGNPDAFYINVHNAEFPNGAVRGQLHR